MNVKYLIVTIVMVIHAIPAFCLDSSDMGLPYRITDDKFNPLRTLVDESLQSSLEDRLNKKKKWAELIAKKKCLLAWLIFPILIKAVLQGSMEVS